MRWLETFGISRPADLSYQLYDTAPVGDIGFSIQEYGEKSCYGIVKQYVGHGIGRNLHEEPQIPNYGNQGKGVELRNGMAIAIEPMFNLGTWETQVLSDDWTVVTADGSLSAHFEDTIIITGGIPQILSEIPGKKNIKRESTPKFIQQCR